MRSHYTEKYGADAIPRDKPAGQGADRSTTGSGARSSEPTGQELTYAARISLDETRMLILGAQILLGFQFRGDFSDGY